MRRRPSALSRAKRALAEHLTAQLTPLDARARTRAVSAVVERLVAQSGPNTPSEAPLIVALIADADSAFGGILLLDTTAAQLTVAYQGASTERARREVLEAHLRDTVGGRALRRDLQALDRWLDLEALQERLSIRLADRIDEMEVAYAAAAALCATLPAGAPRLAALGGGHSVATAFRHAVSGRREIIRRIAVRFLCAVLAGLPERERMPCFGAERMQQALAWARGIGAPRWVQIASLELVTCVSLRRALPTLEAVLADTEARDGMIARRNALRLIAASDLPAKEKLRLSSPCTSDPSEYVGQELALLLATIPGPEALARGAALALRDERERVRGAATRALVLRAMTHGDDLHALSEVFDQLIREATGSVGIAVALESATRLCTGPSPVFPRARFVPALGVLIRRADTPPAQAEQGAALLRRLEVEAAPALLSLSERFTRVLASLPEGKEQTLAVEPTLRLRDVEFALANAARGDLTVSLRALGKGRFSVRRGERRSFKLWRLMHELVTPAPDKRKAFSHTYARTTGRGSLVPTHLLAEVTPTRVPGERRLKPEVGSWGPFLPRIDDLLAASLPWRAPLRIVTSIGVVTVAGPRGLWARVSTWLKLTVRYAHYDRLRERALSSPQAQQKRSFVELCRALGFRVALADTDGLVGDTRYDAVIPRFAQYLGGGALLPELRNHWDSLLQYTLSPTGNSPFHLSALVWTVISGFIVRAAYIMGQIEKARRAIPIGVGGWGTRGKSGTERLKAALFHGLRYDVVVKTTGCEAMFIHARRDLPAREIFIYRPYDKATIWEQRRVLEFGARLRAQVFLWECMALNPKFVQVLNNDWMKDRVTTLTNAYPDHEDVMGPSGEDVARVIGLFMPERGTTYTAEDQMLPILREMARKRGTDLVPVSALEADLLPKDLLSRYPYDEHPRNIALVMALARHYGIDDEFAIVEMGDRVVPDLGVLKTYPTVHYRARELRFSNGMSANERAGFLSNWTRLGFDQADFDAEPTVYTVAVVNNRADRVPRSRVFAEIMTRDTHLSAIVLIGTNLDGMESFIAEALEAELSDLSFSAESSFDESRATLLGWIKRVGALSDPAGLLTQARAMLSACYDAETSQRLQAQPDFEAACLRLEPEAMTRFCAALPEPEPSDVDTADLTQHLQRGHKRQTQVLALRKEVEGLLQKGEHMRATEVTREAMRKLNRARLHILWDAGSKGDQVVDFIARAVPPGHHARLLGCQNIKGTGLDFVYRWLSVGAVTDILTRAEEDESSRADLIASLTTYNDYGILDAQLALRRVQGWLTRDSADWQAHFPLIEGVRDHLQALCDKKAAGLSSTHKKGPLERFVDRGLEPLLDHWDSTRRTELSGKVMNDLFDVRVGQGRAALLLRDLVARQKGGWLAKALFRRK